MQKSAKGRAGPPQRPGPLTGWGSRTASANSFHAGAPIPTLASIRRQSSYRPRTYQTFPTAPPKTPLEQPDGVGSDASSDVSEEEEEEETPLPVRQLLLLAFLSLAEQTALNSISPYLPELVAGMPGIPEGENGLYVGLLASSFALAQLSTNFLWGYASDVIGRKPVLLLGTFALTCCFAVFGLCKRYWHVLVVHVAMGLLNGNAACVPTVLGEVTDRSNQSRAFTYLPVIYSLGSITGPAIGGILVGRLGGEYPYLAPNIFSAAFLGVAVIVVAVWFEETLEEAHVEYLRPAWADRLGAWFSKLTRKKEPAPLLRRNSWSARWPQGSSSGSTRALLAEHTANSDSEDDDADEDDHPSDNLLHIPASPDGTPWSELLNKTTLILLTTYLVFQLSNISFNSLYPIFASTRPPTGRDLNPSKIGLSLSLAGVATIIFQAFLYQHLKVHLGNLGTYRLSLLGMAISMVLMPWVGYIDDKPLFGVGTGRLWLYAELAVVLILKNICAVGGLSSVMLLVSFTPNQSFPGSILTVDRSPIRHLHTPVWAR